MDEEEIKNLYKAIDTLTKSFESDFEEILTALFTEFADNKDDRYTHSLISDMVRSHMMSTIAESAIMTGIELRKRNANELS